MLIVLLLAVARSALLAVARSALFAVEQGVKDDPRSQ